MFIGEVENCNLKQLGVYIRECEGSSWKKGWKIKFEFQNGFGIWLLVGVFNMCLLFQYEEGILE